MSGQPRHETTSLVADGRIVVDTPCAACGYNLRGLADEGQCPECGAGIGWSLGGFWLRNSDPSWVGRLANGLRLILTAIILAIATVIVTTGATLIVAAAYASAGESPAGAMAGISLITSLLFLLWIVLVAIGLYRLSSPDPLADAGSEGWSARRFLRYGWWSLPVLGVLSTISQGVLQWSGASGPDPLRPEDLPIGFEWLSAWLVVQVLVSIVAYGLIPLALVRHLGGLMSRLPRPGLVRFARFLFWSYLILIAVGAFLLAWTFLVVSAPLMRSAVVTTQPAVGFQFNMGSGAFSAQQTRVATTAPTSAAATMPATAPARTLPPRFGTMSLILVGGLSAAASCGGMIWAIALLVFLVRVYSALRQAADEAQRRPAPSAAQTS